MIWNIFLYSIGCFFTLLMINYFLCTPRSHLMPNLLHDRGKYHKRRVITPLNLTVWKLFYNASKYQSLTLFFEQFYYLISVEWLFPNNNLLFDKYKFNKVRKMRTIYNINFFIMLTTLHFSMGYLLL